MNALRKIIQIHEDRCNGCGKCVIACAEGALAIIDGKARIVSDSFCDGLGACIGICPQGALQIIEREAEPFDENAATEHVRQRGHGYDAARLSAHCRSAKLRQLRQDERVKQDSGRQTNTGEPSALMNWPVKIKLVPEDAMFLRVAHVLVVADCVPFAYPALHRSLMKDRATLSGCPKSDPAQLYLDKLTEIFRQNDIQSITVAVMEVPCCQVMPGIVKEALRAASKNVPVQTVVIGIEGKVLKTANNEK